MASGTQHGTEVLDQVIVRFAGDSGDGMQLTGDRFTTSSALLGNDLSTFPDFPAEIRAPAGTVRSISEKSPPVCAATALNAITFPRAVSMWPWPDGTTSVMPPILPG